MTSKKTTPSKQLTSPVSECHYIQLDRVVRLCKAIEKENDFAEQFAPVVLTLSKAYVSETMQDWFSGWDAAVGDIFYNTLCFHVADALNEAVYAVQRKRSVTLYPDMVIFFQEALRLALAFNEPNLCIVVTGAIIYAHSVILKHQDKKLAYQLYKALHPTVRIAHTVRQAVKKDESISYALHCKQLRDALKGLGVSAKTIAVMRSEGHTELQETIENTTSALIDQPDGSKGDNIQSTLRAMMSARLPSTQLTLVKAVLKGKPTTDPYLASIRIWDQRAVSCGRAHCDVSIGCYTGKLLKYLFSKEQWLKLIKRVDEVELVDQAVAVVSSWLQNNIPASTRNTLRQSLLLVPVAQLSTSPEDAPFFAKSVLEDAGMSEIEPLLLAALTCHTDVLFNQMSLGLSKYIDSCLH